MKVKGRVFKYGNDVDTDVIIPARYLNTTSEKELASHCMEDIDPDFIKNVKAGDIIVAEDNFGCGSSREHAPIAIKASGVSTGKSYKAEPFPPFIQEIISDGGLMKHIAHLTKI